MDLANVEPQKISTDLNSYTTFLYGPPKSGKSTWMFELYGDKAIFARTEKGSKLIAGLHGTDVPTWAEFNRFISQLQRPEVKEKYQVVVIDTIDNLYKMLEIFIKNKYDADNIKDANGGYGAGYKEVSEQLFKAFNRIEALGYTLAFISHSTTKAEKLTDGTEVEKYIPSVDKRGLEIATKMVDNLLFNYIVNTPEGEKRALYTRETTRFQAGTRFKYMEPVIEFSAEAYRKSAQDSLNKYDPKALTSETISNRLDEEELNFEELMKEAKALAGKLKKEDRFAEVTKIVEETFGQGKKLTEATERQVETLKLAVQKMKEL